MIVVPRKVGEGVVVGGDITVTVIEVRGDKVRPGVEIPTGMSLHRQEVYDASHGTGRPTPGQRGSS